MMQEQQHTRPLTQSTNDHCSIIAAFHPSLSFNVLPPISVFLFFAVNLFLGSAIFLNSFHRWHQHPPFTQAFFKRCHSGGHTGEKRAYLLALNLFFSTFREDIFETKLPSIANSSFTSLC